ncbi:hypothetical protein A9P82_08030 [Arachidicoccus ginsenosidimutans]|uniref:CHC2 zinc finger domain-containing protein n=1 Tax=Arachidicoccus sp. BS20 TaxID=1850526 RepID=UPI0007F119B0|nr:CHC2 zinc finger domain-containing protein [Arachidicoccus sp. BS20]ANI89243.1 hypothetical protein A9P82_08030 [Arachidicoccus sp. BS20]
MNSNFNFKEAKARIRIIPYLASLGHHPAAQRGNDIWFHSPFHEEKTPSFKVNDKHRIWYDHSLDIGGDLIDLGIKIHGCSHAELLQKFKDFVVFPRQQVEKNERIFLRNATENTVAPDDKKIKIVAERPVFKFYLKSYLRERCIPLDLANQYLKEVDFLNKSVAGNERIYTALGFKNDKGGYELRSKNFKSSSAPKATTLIPNLSSKEARQQPKRKQSIAVIEGFFSFLSFQLLHFHNRIDAPVPDNFLVLNSLSFLRSSFDVLDAFGNKMMLLDNDTRGKSATAEALVHGNNYKDYSHIYSEAKDLNALLVSLHNPLEQIPENMKIHR